MKTFWTAFLHFAMIGGASYLSVKYPAIAPYVVPVIVGAAGVVPHPFDPATDQPPQPQVKP